MNQRRSEHSSDSRKDREERILEVCQFAYVELPLQQFQADKEKKYSHQRIVDYMRQAQPENVGLPES